MRWAGPFLAVSMFILALQLRGRAATVFHAHERYEDIYYLPSPEVVDASTLGFREAFADLIWMRAQVYIGDEFFNRGGSDNVFRYIEAVLRLDPDFVRAYRWIGVTGIYRTRDSTLEEVRRVIDIMERGVARFPNDGELAWELGATYSYDLVPRLEPSDERRRARQRAAELLGLAARRGEGPRWLVFSNAAQLRRLGENEQAIRHLREIYVLTSDPELRTEIEQELRVLQDEVDNEAFLETFRVLEAERLGNYPYLPPTLYLLVGPKPDLNALPAHWFLPD